MLCCKVPKVFSGFKAAASRERSMHIIEGCSIVFTSAKKITLDSIVSVHQLHNTLCCFNNDITESIITPPASFFVRSRGKKHSVILRTQLTVRVHACIGELLSDMIKHVVNMTHTHGPSDTPASLTTHGTAGLHVVDAEVRPETSHSETGTTCRWKSSQCQVFPVWCPWLFSVYIDEKVKRRGGIAWLKVRGWWKTKNSKLQWKNRGKGSEWEIYIHTCGVDFWLSQPKSDLEPPT